MTWWPVLLGWPAIALSVGLAIAGFLRKNEYLVLAATLPVLPIGIYLFGSPVYWWLPVLILTLLVLSAWRIRRDKRARC